MPLNFSDWKRAKRGEEVVSSASDGSRSISPRDGAIGWKPYSLALAVSEDDEEDRDTFDGEGIVLDLLNRSTIEETDFLERSALSQNPDDDKWGKEPPMKRTSVDRIHCSKGPPSRHGSVRVG